MLHNLFILFVRNAVINALITLANVFRVNYCVLIIPYSKAPLKENAKWR
jgi:hypothetical protein